MLILCHLFFGILIGAVIYHITRKKSLFYWTVAGSLLPDFLDKLVGIFLFPTFFGGSRLFAHTLLFLLAWFCIGFLVQARYKTLAGVCLAIGIAIHHILDTLWNEPGTWLYPWYGPFKQIDISTYVQSGFMRELSTISEWFFLPAGLMLWCLVLYYSPPWTQRESMPILFLALGTGLSGCLFLSF